MDKILLWSLAAYGMTSIIVWGSIFEPVRNYIKKHSKFFGDLVSCTLCSSTWVGFFMSIVLGGLTSDIFNIHWSFGIFWDGVFTAGIVWVINSIVEFFEENRLK